MGKRGHSVVGGSCGSRDHRDGLSQPATAASEEEDLRCHKCQKVFSSLGNRNHHLAKCNPKSRQSKRKNSQVYKHFKLKKSDELIELFKKIPCQFLRFKLAAATDTYVPDSYPGVFNVSQDLSAKKAKVDQVCLILADATSHLTEEEGIRIPKYFGKF